MISLFGFLPIYTKMGLISGIIGDVVLIAGVIIFAPVVIVGGIGYGIYKGGRKIKKNRRRKRVRKQIEREQKEKEIEHKVCKQ